MKIKWGALVVDGRGKLGGHVAAQNRGGSYLRTKVTPSNPQSTFQTGVRNLFGSISAGWSDLTAEQRNAWNNAVDSWKKTNIFGDLKIPSGKALYQRLNQQAQVVAYPALTLPPVKEDIPASNVTAVAIDTTAETITATGLYNGTNATIQIFSSGVVSAGTNFVKNLMRMIGHSGGSAYDPSQAFTDYEARFGTPQSGEKIFIGFKVVLPTGQSSPMQVVEATIS